MGWSIGFDEHWKRDIGYGVPAYCDHPDCKEKIDRGLSYVCADEEPRGGDGCGLYFCPKHLGYCTDEFTSCCERCRDGKEPFEPKSEHPEWIAWKATDPSWAKWRKAEAKKKAKALPPIAAAISARPSRTQRTALRDSSYQQAPVLRNHRRFEEF